MGQCWLTVHCWRWSYWYARPCEKGGEVIGEVVAVPVEQRVGCCCVCHAQALQVLIAAVSWDPGGPAKQDLPDGIKPTARSEETRLLCVRNLVQAFDFVCVMDNVGRTPAL